MRDGNATINILPMPQKIDPGESSSVHGTGATLSHLAD